VEAALNPTTPSSGLGQSEELVYAPALLILSQDLYPRKLEVVREYIQNASDALEAFAAISDQLDDPTEPLIKLSIQGRSLVIFDTGIGMDAEEVSKLRRIAYSEKKSESEAGHKGIGRLAGIAVSEKLKISSTSYGDPKLHYFEFRAKEMREDVREKKKSGIHETATKVIERHTKLWDDDIDPKEHFTMVEIRGISDKCPELLDGKALREYLGEVAPVEFSPTFEWASRISQKLRQNVPDYFPKTIYFSAGENRTRIYKPFTEDMAIAEPEFIEVTDPANPNKVLAYCWYATKGQKILGKVRPSGKIFAVDGEDSKKKQRYAGLVFKLFGISVGDRSLPLRALWPKSSPRALWFTGEVHIVDKDISPTTDRSDFVENEARDRLYAAGESIPLRLNKLAQEISDNRKAYDDSEKLRESFKRLRQKLQDGTIQRSELKTIERELYENIETLKRRAAKCRDKEIEDFNKEVVKFGRGLEKELEEAKSTRGQNGLGDIATELSMTSKAKKVFQIIMDTLSLHYEAEPEDYYEVAGKIERSLRKKYS
jgi:Histidine kinase-, DNA gyrase B-, and HSP90-like ATPase